MAKFFLYLMLCATLLGAQEAQGLKTNVGILNFDIRGGEPAFGEQVLKAVKQSLLEVGAYELYPQDAMEKAYAVLKIRFPQNCSEPRCAAAIGSAISMDRMLYGSVDKNEKTFAVRFTLVDVPSHQIIEMVELEGEPGVGVADVVKTAVLKLHGQLDGNVNTKTHTYYGPQVHNERQLAVSAPACIGVGLVMGLANGSIVGRDDNDAVLERDYAGFDADGEKLLGVSTGADRIPLFGRPSALANAYVAASDDAAGVFYNPAGLSWVAGAEAALAYQYRFGINNFAASYVNKATREIGFGQGIVYSGDELLSEMYFISSFSYKFNELVSWLRPLSLGASVKVATKWTGKPSTPSASTGSAFAAALDLGLRWQLTENIHYGCLFRNVPSFGRWHNTATDTSYFEGDAPNLAMGGTFQADYATFLICEGRIPLNEDQKWVFAGGIERELFDLLRLRIGIEKMADFETPWKFTAGFGFKVDIADSYVVIDGSYEYNTLAVFAHPINISLRFGF
jgi:hypothetical protein